MKIVVVGGSGVLGAKLVATLSAGVQTYLASLKQSAESQDPVLREAFAAAPACQARKTAASPSS